MSAHDRKGRTAAPFKPTEGAPLQARLSCARCGFGGVWELTGLGVPCCPGCNVELKASASADNTEARILDAMPHDLVRLLTGAVLAHIPDTEAVSRAHLVATHRALMAERLDLSGALLALRRGLSMAITPEQVEPRPETALLQVAFWLLTMQAQAAELHRACLVNPPTKH